jgi:3-oxo-5-alpha-steroid 4-dehydrogenase 1
MNWYTGDTTFDTVLTIGLAFAAFTIVAGAFAQSPYGRFASDKYGINLNAKLGWWLMEIPATASFLWFYLNSDSASWTVTTLFLGGLWMLHYGNRGWFFPLSIRVAPNSKSSFSFMVMSMGMFVTAIHAYLNAEWFTRFGKHLTPEWLTDPRFIIGLCIYALGFFLIVTSEHVVRNLRSAEPKPDEPKYKIPRGFGYNWVSSPQYLGELIVWAGFSILTWGLPGVMIFLISAGNLVPRAFGTHKWYKEKFPEYPANRKALIPYVL